MITLSAHQPAYLPWLGYFNKMAHADIFVILDAVQFEKGSYVNRNRIKGPNGPFWLTVPLESHPIETDIGELRIIDNGWEKEHTKSIQQAYARATCIWEYENCVPVGTRALLDGVWHFADILHMYPELWEQGVLGIGGRKQQLIINLCKHFGADRFIFGAQGRDYCALDLFKREGIEPLFQDFNCIEYPQLWGPFVPRLSVIDALMNVGAKRTRELIIEGWKP